MAAQNIDLIPLAKVSRFAKLWPLLLSAIVLIISAAFCLINMNMLFPFPQTSQDFAVLVAHNHRMTFLRPLILNNLILVEITIWLVIGIFLAAAARTLLGKVVLVFSFVVAIPLLVVGFLFGLLVDFSPVDSLVLSSNSFNLGYFDDSSGEGMFYFYDCDPQGMNCKKLWQLRSSYEPQSVTGLQFDDSNNQVEILINGEVVYAYPLE